MTVCRRRAKTVNTCTPLSMKHGETVWCLGWVCEHLWLCCFTCWLCYVLLLSSTDPQTKIHVRVTCTLEVTAYIWLFSDVFHDQYSHFPPYFNGVNRCFVQSSKSNRLCVHFVFWRHLCCHCLDIGGDFLSGLWKVHQLHRYFYRYDRFLLAPVDAATSMASIYTQTTCTDLFSL